MINANLYDKTLPLRGMRNGQRHIRLVAAAVLTSAAMVCHGQSEARFEAPRTIEERFVAPSPQMSEMMRYEDAVMNSCDGTATMSVPLFAWQAGEIQVSLALNYRIGAFKAEEQPGWIALGWSLAGTGAVNRTIAGLPDEMGYEARSASMITAADDGADYLRRLDRMQLDATLDRYSYSCPGASGQFVIIDGEIVQLPQSDNEISFISPGEPDAGFRVITPDGTRYDFTVTEHTRFSYQAMDLSSPPYHYSYNAVSAWHLSKITSPSGETMTYEYATIPTWTRDHNRKSYTRTIIKSSDGEVLVPQWSPGGDVVPNTLTATNRTVFSDQKILKAIHSRTADLTVTHQTKTYLQQGPSRFISAMTLKDKQGNEVSAVNFAAEGTYRRLLSSVEKLSDGKRTDFRQFTYHADNINSEASTDWFGYPNSSSDTYSQQCAVDPTSLRFNTTNRNFNRQAAQRGAMKSWTTITGTTTSIDYEPSAIPRVSLKPYNMSPADSTADGYPADYGTASVPGLYLPTDTIIGLRIKSITTSDAVSGTEKIRTFRYERAVSSVDLSSLSEYDFIAASGSYSIGNSLITYPQKSWTKTTSFSFLRSGKLPGSQPENARVYYGLIAESVSGTGIAHPILTEYEYDTSGSQAKFVPSSKDYNPYSSSTGETDPGVPPNPAVLRPLANLGIPTGGTARDDFYWTAAVGTRGYFRELAGAEPKLARKTAYRWTGDGYTPLEQTEYSYRTSDDTTIVTGTCHQALVRMKTGANGITDHEYADINHFNYFQTTLRCMRSELVAEKTTKYFTDGSSRVREVTYHYTNDVTSPVSHKFERGGISAGDLQPLVPAYSPFGTDSLSLKSDKHLLTGFTITEGGHTLGQHTALAANASDPFYAAARSRGIYSLPVARMWQVDNATPLLERTSYAMYGSWLRPGAVSLGLKGKAPIATQTFGSYNTHGMPGWMQLSGQPLKTYSWDSLDQLLSLTSGSLTSTFTYTPLVGCTSIKYPSGRREWYSYTAGRLSGCLNTSGQKLRQYEYGYCNDDDTQLNPYGGNFIRTTAYTASGSGGTTTVYYDGFGNEIISRAHAYGSQGDVITATDRDALGRPLRQWMPMPFDMLNMVSLLPDELTEGARAAFRDSIAYTSMSYPASAEGYAAATTLAGSDFAGHPATVTMTCSNPADALRKVVRYTYNAGVLTAAGYYGAGELDAVHTVDADGCQSIVFTDCLGRTMLSRSVAGPGIYADTYTVSDEWGDPLVVIPPVAAAGLASGSLTAAAVMDQYAYVYTYDDRRLMRSRRLPGCETVRYVYDSGGRLVFSRDGNQSGQGRRSFVLYDSDGRMAVTGTCADALSDTIWNGNATVPCAAAVRNGGRTGGNLGCGYDAPAQLLSLLSDVALLTVNYYDDYTFAGSSSAPANCNSSPEGLLTGTLNAVLDDSETPQLLLTVSYYDTEDRLIKSVAENHISGQTTLTNTYTAYGLLLQSEEQVSGKISPLAREPKTQSHRLTYTYDAWGRPLGTALRYCGRDIALGTGSYNSCGRTGGISGIEGDLSVMMTYTMHGWTEQIVSPYMTQRLRYASGSATPSYSGRVSAKIGGRAGVHESAYNYSYDLMGRLVAADYTRGGYPDEDYSTAYSYDLEANLLSVVRHGPVEPQTFGVLDDITVQYDGGRITRTTHAAPTAFETSPAPAEVNTGYDYDANGNLVKDPGRDIESIVYNVINQPRRINFADDSWIEFTYLADGTKLSMTTSVDRAVIVPTPGPDVPVTPADSLIGGTHQVPAKAGGIYAGLTTHYVGSYETSGSNFERAQVPGGFVTMSDSVFHWYLTDYQGNICGVVNSRSDELEQWQEFYPYGKPQTLLPAYSVGDGSVNDRKFGGKELITAKGFDAYDFEARPLTVSIPRFTQPDPMAEKYYPISLYAYCGGDPVNLVDKNGKKWEKTEYKEKLMEIYNRRLKYYEKEQKKLAEKRMTDKDQRKLKLIETSMKYLQLFESAINTIDSRSELFYLKRVSEQGPFCIRFGKRLKIEINFGGDGTVAHEVLHAYQCLKSGNWSMEIKSKNLKNSEPLLPDMPGLTEIPAFNAEIEAYRLQYVIDPDSLPVSVHNILDIDFEYVANLKNEDGSYIYKDMHEAYEAKKNE